MNIMTLRGSKNKAKIFTHNVEETAIGQVIGMLNEPITENTTVAIMPDVHAGAGSTIGTTIRLPENKADWKVCPNVVGVDIGCSILAYLDGKELDDYLNDIAIAQKYSTISRQAMLYRIAEAMDWEIIDEFESMHNYIDIENGIVRKGATSAQAGERLIIPLNMRDGSIFATGKGNPEWSFSAPHGAGRVLSRSKAKAQLSLEDYRKTMEGIYTTSICEATLDEAPFAYKESQEIIDAITNTATVDMIVKPIYNFKAH